MKTQLSLTLLILLITANFSQAQSLNNFFSETDKFLNKWVKNGYINYGNLNGDFDEIEKLQVQIANIKLSNATEEEKKAFYINAYNLIVIYQIAKYYPLKSPLDRSGFFDKFRHQVAGESITLDYIEKKYLILKYKDPRIHFVVSCAAVSCPPLASFAFVPSKLNQQLDERTKHALTLDFVLDLNRDKKQVNVSKIFDWYKRDFGNSTDGIVNFINMYRTLDIPKEYEVIFLDYKWSVNAIN